MLQNINLFLDKHFWTFGKVLLWENEGESFVPDGEIAYNVPENLSAITNDDDFELLFHCGLCRLYGVQDNSGKVHVNGKDFEKLRKFMLDPNVSSIIQQRRLWRYNIEWVFVDYKSDEEYRMHLFERIIK